ncbi:MAG: tRNA dimethylallyltransferase [Flavobacteriales bacterium]|jgi:tRNA dimethylallyltransferase
MNIAANKSYLIVIVGPTAIGKTSLSIELAKHYNCEIISADSRQFFKELEIGTAKPTDEEQDGVKHHFIDSHSITDNYNVGQYELEVIELLNTIHSQNNLAILVGGSGLYVNAVCDGIDDIPSDSDIRSELNLRLETEGLEVLQLQLQILDPEHFEKCNIKNPQRVIRALEVCLVSGKTYTSFRTNTKKKRNFEIIRIGLNMLREDIYDNINQRVDIMINNGLIEEVQSVAHHREQNALNTVGYKEIFQYLDGNITLEESILLLKKNTRNFAKRQLTWFRKNQETQWFSPQSKEEIIQHIENSME